jgi:uroporphyrin-III C-methyltransferase
LSVPASIQIPITARGVSESFWVVTGTTKNGEVSSDLVLAAQSSATIVILMGLHKIQEIMEQFDAFGKGEMPVAVIQNGTLPTQRSIVGTVNNIVSLAKRENIGGPAVIVVGEVVRYAKQLNSVLLETIEN